MDNRISCFLIGVMLSIALIFACPVSAIPQAVSTPVINTPVEVSGPIASQIVSSAQSPLISQVGTASHSQDIVSTPAGVISDDAPTITSIKPAIGRAGYRVNVTQIKGTNFKRLATVQLVKDPYYIQFASIKIKNNMTMSGHIYIPSSIPGGIYDVSITNTDGESGALENGFIIQGPAPRITRVNPLWSQRVGNVSTLIYGRNFIEGSTVTFVQGNVSIKALDVSGSGSSLLCILPLTSDVPLGRYDVYVSMPTQQTAVKRSAFKVIA